MNPETIKSIQDALAPLADKVGQGAGHLYAVYARQMFAEGLANILVSLSVAVLVPIVWFVYWRLLKAKVGIDERYPDYFGYIASAVVLTILSCALLGGAMAGLYDGTLKMINPEYYALDRIIITVRGNAK